MKQNCKKINLSEFLFDIEGENKSQQPQQRNQKNYTLE